MVSQHHPPQPPCMKSGPFLLSVSLTLLSSIESSSNGPVFKVTTTEDATTTSTETCNSAVLTIATIRRRIRIRAYIDSNSRIRRIKAVLSWGPLTVLLGYRFGHRLQLFVEVVDNEDSSVRVVLEEICKTRTLIKSKQRFVSRSYNHQ